MTESITAEQQARNMLERIGVPDAQRYSSGDLLELANLIARVALAQPDSPAEGNAPHGYAYRYPSPFGGTVLRFNGGVNVNGCRPIEAIPYWLGQPPAPEQPVPVSERLPEPNVKVLAHYFNALGKGRTVCAIWVPAKTRSEDEDIADDDFTEYDEETDTYYWLEGWYEAIESWDDLGWVKIDAAIAYWQYLPKWPAYALPVPPPHTQVRTTNPMAFIYNYKQFLCSYSTECSSLEEAIYLAASDLENGRAWPVSIFQDDRELWSSRRLLAVSESLKAFSEANSITFPLYE